MEPEPTVGAHVRMKDDLRGPGKFRKISGREGVLLTSLGDGDWMVMCDGSKEKTRVARDEFVGLAPAAGADEGNSQDVEAMSTTLDPAAAWPFPISRHGQPWPCLDSPDASEGNAFGWNTWQPRINWRPSQQEACSSR